MSCHINSLLAGGPRLLRCLGVLSYQQDAQALPANVLARYPYATGAAAHVWAACEAATFTSGSEDSKLHLCGSASHGLSPSKTHPSQRLSEFDKSCTFTLLILLFASSLRSMVGWTWLKVFFQKATKDTIYTITSMNLTANNLTDLMDRIGPSNSTEVQKGAKLEGATHYAQATAQIIAYVSYVYICIMYVLSLDLYIFIYVYNMYHMTCAFLHF